MLIKSERTRSIYVAGGVGDEELGLSVVRYKLTPEEGGKKTAH
jgi:hypothetical protein